MQQFASETGLPPVLNDVVTTAMGTAHREDPVAPHTGGPAGNARLTAWAGLFLLVAFLVECFTLLSLNAMINIHILLGAFLIPLVLLKTATTGWRIVRYYLGASAYRAAGPPPLVLRVLGPLVVLTGLAVVGSGLALVPLGDGAFSSLGSVVGFRISPLTLHQASFIAWLVATGLHVLARTVPAVQVAAGGRPHRRRVPGSVGRGVVMLGTLALGAAIGVLVLHRFEVRPFTEQQIASFLNIDFIDHVALVAVVEESARPTTGSAGRVTTGATSGVRSSSIAPMNR